LLDIVIIISFIYLNKINNLLFFYFTPLRILNAHGNLAFVTHLFASTFLGRFAVFFGRTLFNKTEFALLGEETVFL